MATKYLAGEYVVVITDWGLSESRVKKTPQFVLKFRPLGKVNPNDPTGDLMQCPGDERSLYLYITQNTKDMFRKAMDYLGYNKESFKYLNRDVEGAHDFLNKEINVRCEHEEYEGSVNERWNLCTSADIKPLDEMRIMELDSMFGKSGGSVKPKTNGSKKPAPARATAPKDDSEIPF